MTSQDLIGAQCPGRILVKIIEIWKILEIPGNPRIYKDLLGAQCPGRILVKIIEILKILEILGHPRTS